MDDIHWLYILKWVFIVLLAGFIGQFGKSFAKHLMEKAKLKRAKAVEGQAKVAIPREKVKESDAITDQGQILSPEEAKERAKQAKKLAKAMAKQKKKEVKTLEKGKQ